MFEMLENLILFMEYIFSRSSIMIDGYQIWSNRIGI
jgi:hypothetical protein